VLVLLLLHTADDPAFGHGAGEVVGERGQRLDDVLGIGDLGLPLDARVLAAQKLVDIDRQVHGEIVPDPATTLAHGLSTGNTSAQRSRENGSSSFAAHSQKKRTASGSAPWLFQRWAASPAWQRP